MFHLKKNQYDEFIDNHRRCSYVDVSTYEHRDAEWVQTSHLLSPVADSTAS
ncbi:MAG: hypothetical protein IJ550_07650 [Bacteroidaceae bacterium]|nr:hypothetical protein [Bacteroidaceae bacterium]